MQLLRLFSALIVLQATAWQAAAQQPVPSLRARVTDNAAVLALEQASAIENRLAEFEKSKGSQIAVLIVQTTEPETIEQFALRAAETWKLGRKRVDDGVLFVVAVKDRRMRIEVGYGLEGALNDAVCKRIIDEIVKPHFKQGDYAAGISAGLEQMIRVISGEALPPPGFSFDKPDQAGKLLGFAFIAAIILGMALRDSIGRSLSATLSGAALILAGIIVALMLPAVIMAIIAFVVVLTGKAGGRHAFGRHSGGWSGGSGGGSGGFSGGGGSFGGGGASGGW